MPDEAELPDDVALRLRILELVIQRTSGRQVTSGDVIAEGQEFFGWITGDDTNPVVLDLVLRTTSLEDRVAALDDKILEVQAATDAATNRVAEKVQGLIDQINAGDEVRVAQLVEIVNDLNAIAAPETPVDPG